MNPKGRQYDAAQLRVDTWNLLHYHAKWLVGARSHQIEDVEPTAICADALATLRAIELYWAFPGIAVIEELEEHFRAKQFDRLSRRASHLSRLIIGEGYRDRIGTEPRLAYTTESESDRPQRSSRGGEENGPSEQAPAERPYFELLVVDAAERQDEDDFRERMLALRRPDDEFHYGVVRVPSFEDAVIAALFNHTIQSVVMRYAFPFRTAAPRDIFDRYLDMLEHEKPDRTYGLARSVTLGRVLRSLRPELDLFLVTDAPVEDVAGHIGHDFRRTFYRLDNYLELHLSVLKGIAERYETPFFNALRRYSRRPTGVFHALPISRAKSITSGHWIRDMAQFYGTIIFMAETSATSGGLDSLLDPHGPIKRAQELAARAFGARRSFFVTNGTTSANKIVVQAITRPGDIVMLSHDCHKSHHYALMLAGAMPAYLDAYPLPDYTMYGGVTLHDIKRRLLDYKRAGQLDRVRMLLLTNCTFDGITYDAERIMAEVLAIKPDMIFVWDEAWFAFARLSPTLRRRTGMRAARALRDRLRSDAYRAEYAQWKASFDQLDASDDATWLDRPLLPDPDAARVRVYATQSTHKTLTSLRQGSMIHIYDEDFEQKAQEAFVSAFMTHTSTSPNYQIVASLDVGRRQAELEGYELVARSISLAMALRQRIYEHPLIRRYFKVLRPADMIPAPHRPSGLEFYYDRELGWARMEDAWWQDEFCLDPTRVTVHIGRTGMDGDTFRHLLIDRFDIQINKTSRNTVLFMTNIGMTRGDVAYLVEVLAKIAQEIDERLAHASEVDRRMHERRVRELTEDLPPLPNFSRFHRAFRPSDDAPTPEGDLRSAAFLAYDDQACEYRPLDAALCAAIDAGEEVVSAAFVTPYPPGFPILVPGQVISPEIIQYLSVVDVKEIHGYRRGYGLRVFRPAVLERAEGA